MRTILFVTIYNVGICTKKNLAAIKGNHVNLDTETVVTLGTLVTLGTFLTLGTQETRETLETAKNFSIAEVLRLIEIKVVI